jgi:hypothetical protein
MSKRLDVLRDVPAELYSLLATLFVIAGVRDCHGADARTLESPRDGEPFGRLFSVKDLRILGTR